MPQDYLDIAAGLPPPGPQGVSRVSRLNDMVMASEDGAAFAGFGLGPDYWLGYWAKTLAAKSGAPYPLWCCVAKSDFVGAPTAGVQAIADYQDYISGGGGAQNNVVAGSGKRQFLLTAGSTGGSFVGFGSPGTFTAATLVPSTLNGHVIESARLKRWGVVFRFKLPTVQNANTIITFGIRDSTGLFIGFGSVNSLSATRLTAVKGSTTIPNVAGDNLSTKAPDVNNYVWGYLYNDLDNIKFSIDGEPDLVCCTSVTAGNVPAYVYAINAPQAGAVVESFEMDKYACFTEM